MKIVTPLTLFILLIFSASSFADNEDLVNQCNVKIKEAQKGMEVIKKTEDQAERERLLDEHVKTMQEFNELVLQFEVDPERGGKGQGTQMSEIMHERVRYLEQMMQQLLENQSEREKIENN